MLATILAFFSQFFNTNNGFLTSPFVLFFAVFFLGFAGFAAFREFFGSKRKANTPKGF